jgi:hypothetical protein
MPLMAPSLANKLFLDLSEYEKRETDDNVGCLVVASRIVERRVEVQRSTMETINAV